MSSKTYQAPLCWASHKQERDLHLKLGPLSTKLLYPIITPLCIHHFANREGGLAQENGIRSYLIYTYGTDQFFDFIPLRASTAHSTPSVWPNCQREIFEFDPQLSLQILPIVTYIDRESQQDPGRRLLSLSIFYLYLTIALKPQALSICRHACQTWASRPLKSNFG